MFGKYRMTLDVVETDKNCLDVHFGLLDGWLADRGDQGVPILASAEAAVGGEIVDFMVYPIITLGDLALSGQPVDWSALQWRNVKEEEGSTWSKTLIFEAFDTPGIEAMNGRVIFTAKGLLRQHWRERWSIALWGVKEAILPKHRLHESLARTAEFLGQAGLVAGIT